MDPWPSGPPACGQMPSNARSSSPRLQTAKVLSPTAASITLPGGSAESEPTFTNDMDQLSRSAGRICSLSLSKRYRRGTQSIVEPPRASFGESRAQNGAGGQEYEQNNSDI